jgi:uncharacterized protein
MGKTSLAVVQDFYAAVESGNMEGILATLATDVSWGLHGPSIIPYFGTFQGHGGVQDFFRRLFEVEEVLEFMPMDFVDDGVTVVAIGHERCKVKKSEKEFSVPWAQIFTVKDGKIARFQEFIDTATMAEAYS